MNVRRACVIGWPVSHSRSPLIHGYWLKRYGIEGEYGREAVKPENVDSFIKALPQRGYIGCNVTLPHKEAAFRNVRLADEATARLGVVNTVFLKGGEAWGTSTDGEGFLANLAAASPLWSAQDKRVVLLGAGGSARAIVGALIDQRVSEIIVINRSRERAEHLRQQFGGPVHVSGWNEIGKELATADLLVNTTSLGMTGQPALDIDLSALPPNALVADIIYTPLETALIGRARALGNPVAPGLGMLLHQAVRGFELWFGMRPEVTPELHDLIAADIAAGGP
jgi:shikimate dehydrogenase